jgi:hypothetical protein
MHPIAGANVSLKVEKKGQSLLHMFKIINVFLKKNGKTLFFFFHILFFVKYMTIEPL